MFKRVLSMAFGVFVIGVPLAVIFMALGFIVPVKTIEVVYDASLFIPQKLGIVDRVSSDEIIEMSGGQEKIVHLSRNGRYRIYSEEPLAVDTEITIISEDGVYTTEAVALNDGLRIYVDEPQYVFDLDAAGSYTISAKSIDGKPIADNAIYTIVPYLGNQYAAVAILSGIIQVTLIAFGIRSLYRFVYKKRIQEEKESQDKKRGQFEAFIDEEIQGGS